MYKIIVLRKDLYDKKKKYNSIFHNIIINNTAVIRTGKNTIYVSSGSTW